MDDYFVTSQGTIFGGRGIFAEPGSREQIYEQIRARIVTKIHEIVEDDVLGADPDTWASGLAESHHLTPPRVDIAAAELKRRGRVQVDCTNAPGISYSLSEYGQVSARGHVARST